MYLQKSNNAKSLVTDNPLTAGATTVNVTTSDGALFPSTGDFMLTIWDEATYPDPGDDPNMEIVRATARSTDAITITRAQEGTSGVSHAQGSRIAMLITAETLVELGVGSIHLAPQAAKIGHLSAPAGIDGGQNRWYLVFDDTTPQSAEWQFIMPYSYASNMTLTAKVIYSMASAITGTVEVEISIMANADGETIETDSFDTVNNGSVTVPGTAGQQDTIEVTLSNKDSVAAGELVIVKISRDADDGTNDTATGNMEIAGIILEWK